ncbi:hypothetical protein N480_14045 [Pseudoalteromonas luteoviolacea S2607]|nr:hypothetical protein N480_14045 [Pseudoalteromonas luteoviolacea S2607]
MYFIAILNLIFVILFFEEVFYFVFTSFMLANILYYLRVKSFSIKVLLSDVRETWIISLFCFLVLVFPTFGAVFSGAVLEFLLVVSGVYFLFREIMLLGSHFYKR